MWIRPKRMWGSPGIWARETDGTWTIFSFAGIVAEGLTEVQATEQLKVLELTTVPLRVGDRVKGDTWSLNKKP